MRIAFLGNFMARHCTEVHLAATFESLGHEVVKIQEGPPDTVRGTTAEKVLEIVRDARPQLFQWQRTWRIPGDQRAMLAAIAELSIPTVAYHLDLYAPIQRGSSGGADGRGVIDDPWWRCKYAFTPDGDPGSAEFFRAHGIAHHYIPPAVYHGECYIGEPDPAFAVDVAFVGSYHYHAEWPWRPRLIDWLTTTYGDRFRLFPGPGRDAVRNEALNRLYASAKVVVGDSLVPGFTHLNYTSDRLFETLGRGGFLVYPRIKGVTDGTLVTEGEHIAGYTFGDFDGLKRTVDYYLENANERKRIRRAGHEHVKANHTYQHRLSEMLSIVGKAEGWQA